MNNYKSIAVMALSMLIFGSVLPGSALLAQQADQGSANNININKTSEDNTSKPTNNSSSNSMPVSSRKIDETPYIAVVTGDDVYVRSGPATPYYPVCKLSKGQEVIVTLVRPGKRSWARVEPVPGTIAYISKQFVRLIDITAIEGAQSAGDNLIGKEVLTGVVSGSNVRVRAGSVDMAPKDAYRVLMVAQKGQQVSITGEVGDFYKIVPPKGCYFWVCSDFLSAKGQATELDLNVLRDQTDKELKDVVEPGQLKGEYVTLKEILDKYEAVQAISLMDRNYDLIKADIQKLVEQTDSPTVKSTAEVLLKNVVRGENAQKQVSASIEQDKKIEDAMTKIDQAVIKALKEISPADSAPDVLVVKGKLSESAVFTSGVSKRYVLIDDTGIISCYVSGENLEKYVGKSVSVSGPVSYDPFGKTRVVEAVKVVTVE